MGEGEWGGVCVSDVARRWKVHATSCALPVAGYARRCIVELDAGGHGLERLHIVTYIVCTEPLIFDVSRSGFGVKIPGFWNLYP